MRILVLAWEFPPRIVGGISRHVAELYPELVNLGHDVHLVTVEFGTAPPYEIVDGMHVHRVSVGPSHDFFHWVNNMNQSMGHEGGRLLLDQGPFDVIHAHDWLVGDAAIALKEHFKVPLITTIHATEFGRYNGLFDPTHYYIASREGLLIYNSWRVIVCTDYMRREVERALACPVDKVDVIYNGIRPEKKYIPPNFDHAAFRSRYAGADEKIVYYVGRMAYEKGVHVLVEAAPKVVWEMGGRVKFVIIGGGNTDHLKRMTWDVGLWHKFYFTGFMPDQDLDKFQVVADCAVFPSLYEPFGIVALESFAARVPVVVSDTGGLPEVVQHGKTGTITYTNNPNSLAWGILKVLRDPDYAQQLVANAYADLDQRFSWPKIAKQTEAVYKRVVKERLRSSW